MKKFLILFIFCLPFYPAFCQSSVKIQLGADKVDSIIAKIKGKRVALVVNQTSLLSNGTHLLDTLLNRDVNIKKIFAPEHGFRGDADAGEKIVNGKDSITGIDVISLYGKNNKPTPQQLADVDIVIFDIQDVGARFYTYISTMHYVMEACGENNKMCLILDRPNPHDYVDGPILDVKYKSFVGMHPIPILHGLTIGELASMINGEGWLKEGIRCKLNVITMNGWKHGQPYDLPVKPSPNLPNAQSIYLYSSLCFFEATQVSVGRGTDFPFQVVGSPGKKYGDFSFTPHSVAGAKNPLLKDKLCYGVDLRNYRIEKGGLTLKFLLEFYHKSGLNTSFFSSPGFMDLLSGGNTLRHQIIEGMSEEEIRQSWEPGLKKYKQLRTKYLLYP